QLVEWSFLGAEFERRVEVDLGGPFKHLPRGLARPGVRVLVNVAPCAGRVWPNHETKTLDQAIAASAAVIGAADVFGDPCGLGIAENRNARGRDMAMSAHDPVEGIGRLARPGGQVKPSCVCLVFAVEMLEQRNQFISLNQDSY